MKLKKLLILSGLVMAFDASVAMENEKNIAKIKSKNKKTNYLESSNLPNFLKDEIFKYLDFKNTEKNHF